MMMMMMMMARMIMLSRESRNGAQSDLVHSVIIISCAPGRGAADDDVC